MTEGAGFVIGIDGDGLDAFGVVEELGVLAVAGVPIDAVLTASAGRRREAEELVGAARLPVRIRFADRMGEAAPAAGVLLLSDAGGGETSERAWTAAGLPTARVPLPLLNAEGPRDRYRARRVLPLLDAVEAAMGGAMPA